MEETMEQGSRKRFVKKDWIAVCILSFIHLLLSGIYRLFFYRYDTERELYFEFPTPRNGNMLSLESEKIMSIILSGIMGAVLIVIIWYVLIRSVKERRKGVLIIIISSLIMTFVLFPVCFLYQYDTFEVYFEAITNRPDYWQNVYSTCIYNACLLVFPQSFMVTLIQITAFLGMIYYLSVRFGNIFSERARLLPWLLIMVPGSLEVASNSYRNCINTILCMGFMGLIFCDLIEQRKRSRFELLLLGICSSFLAVFRSEQILFFVIYIAALCFIYKLGIKNSVLYLSLMIAVGIVLMLPQKMGENKYYGKDYAMLNQMESLRLVLSEKNVDLTYDGAKEDIDEIEKIVPLEMVKRAGINGYFAQLYMRNGSVRQSFLGLDQQKRFIRSVDEVLLHNPLLFAKARIQIFLESSGIPSNRYDGIRLTKTEAEVNSYYYNSVLLGKAQMYEDLFKADFIWNDNKNGAFAKIIDYYNGTMSYLGKYGTILSFWLVVLFIFGILGHYLRKEDIVGRDEKSFMMITTLVLYFQVVGIFVFAPDARIAYYYPVIFEMMVGIIIFLTDYRYKKKNIGMDVNVEKDDNLQDNTMD